ncbi:MAG: hypothetical protein ACK4WG_12875 [Aphanizomenon sp.]
MVSQEVGYNVDKQIKERKRFMTVDTLGLILRVLIAAANVPERCYDSDHSQVISIKLPLKTFQKSSNSRDIKPDNRRNDLG